MIATICIIAVAACMFVVYLVTAEDGPHPGRKLRPLGHCDYDEFPHERRPSCENWRHE